MQVWAKSRTSGEDAQSFACGICAVAVAPLHIPMPLAGAGFAQLLSLLCTSRCPSPGRPVFSVGFAHCVRTSRSACGGACQIKNIKPTVQASLTAGSHFLSAERTGFEPVSRFRRLHAFQACLFNHSSIFPVFRCAKIWKILQLFTVSVIFTDL